MPRFMMLLALVAGAAHVSAVKDTPVAEVITLLEDLQSSIQTEGTSEATAYDAYACFCRDTTSTKSTSITSGQDNIDTLSADIEEKTASQATKVTELGERKATQEQLQQELAEATAQYRKDQAVYEATSADLTKAISSATKALNALQNAQPAATEAAEATSLVSIRKSVKSFLAVGEALHIVSKKQVVGFLQQVEKVDPADPEYKFHSNPIIDIIQKVLTQFQDKKTEVDTEWGKTRTTYESMSSDLNGEMSTNQNAMEQLETDIDGLKSSIAQSREDLVSAEAMLKDDQTYLKDLTMQCEARAKDWDQRSQMRNGELKAISEALAILKDEVQSLDTAVNVRALLQKPKAPAVQSSKLVSIKAASKVASKVPISFLQQGPAQSKASGSFLSRSTTSQDRRKEHALSVLGAASKRLNSATLAGITMSMNDDPFLKVKKLIQGLIERLIAEATAEASKKGFCDTELGKATQERQFRFDDTKKLNIELADLEIKRDELTNEIEELGTGIVQLNNVMNSSTTIRETDKQNNMETIQQAKDGIQAVSKAILILKSFYKQAAKGASLLQASPVDEDTSGPGFEGAYTGKQDSAGGVIGLLEVIKSDFERTLATTEAAEKKAAADFVEFVQTSKADIAGKTTKKELDEQDLQTTTNTISQKMADLTTAQELLDKALQEMEALKPMCIDSGMTFAERTAKRQEEIDALKSALCILDENQVEEECQGA